MSDRRPCVAVLHSLAGNEVARVPTWDEDLANSVFFYSGQDTYLATEIWFVDGDMFVDMHPVDAEELIPRKVDAQEAKRVNLIQKPQGLPMHSLLFAQVATHKMSIGMRGNPRGEFTRPGAKLKTGEDRKL